ncbi:MAG TPA: hypothetical protein VFQ53_40825 [Kofleriaceae bacterium]|nr:hypothetical protein [Kofleriaceae bacterium]
MVTKAVSANAAPEPHLGLVDGTITAQGTLLIKELKKFASLAKAGLKAGDEIIAFGPIKGGDMEKEVERVKALMAQTGVGGTIPVRMRRAGKISDVQMKLVAKKTLNLSLEDVDLELERKIAP